MWGRYIDDDFIIWSGDRDSFCNFVAQLNINNLGLRFTYETHRDQLCFLDVLISRNSSGGFTTNIYRKPTAGNSLLRWDSYHPQPLRKGIPKGQYFRIRRNCSTIQNFESESDNLYNRFRDRGYPKRVLHEAYNHARQQRRSTLLTPCRKQKEKDVIRLVGTYDEAALTEKYLPHFGRS